MMNKSNVDLSDDSEVEKFSEVENSTANDSDSETFVRDRRNGANQPQRPISSTSVDVTNSFVDYEDNLIQRGARNTCVFPGQGYDSIETVSEASFENGTLTSTYDNTAISLSLDKTKLKNNSVDWKGASLETKYINPSTLDIERRLNNLISYDDPSLHSNEAHPNSDIFTEDIKYGQYTYNPKDADALLAKVEFPAVPQSPPSNINYSNSGDEALSADGGQSISSAASSHSFCKSYKYSSASEDVFQCIPDTLPPKNVGEQILIPKFRTDGAGYCWPTDKFPLCGRGYFHERYQWNKSTKLGSGASGECFIGYITKQVQNDAFCVKQVCKYNKEELLSMYLAGKDQAKRTSHFSGSESIVSFYGATIWKNDVHIFMELMIGGTVAELIKDKDKGGEIVNKSDYLSYLNDVLNGLSFLHSKGRAHNDVKAANVLLDFSKLKARLADFGNATPICENDNSKRKDILSAGCFLLEMLDIYDSKEILKLKHGNAKDLKEHRDQDTNNILKMFFGKESYNDNNTAKNIAEKCEGILRKEK